ncbi:DUF1080 domain-containing protein [Chitinophaga silvatica]|uniref:DUF1080 domain-containing protein n=1 Tax=Chitinophaga silvatica TaxID=2282649 RepID=A0A3E1Y1Y0_9BACT|nr:DUF1080 domain-containing protein [Chitinophaga silvatica]RFS18700.1 DUF1080 domain-containing protein [Chitinophaga silvatica]
MKKVILLFTACAFSTVVAVAQKPALTKKEKKAGWHLLFDGKTTNGWKAANGKPFPEKGWVIKDYTLQTDPASGHGGDIITDTKYTDFELSLDFRVTKGANSGIKYYLLPNSSLGLEFQVIDDLNHPDAKLGMNGNRTQASLYDLITASASKENKPVGEWNQARIVSKGTHVEHWLNGVKVVEFERGSDAFKALVAASKYKNIKGFSEVTETPILLQEHGDEVAFRNIKIKAL